MERKKLTDEEYRVLAAIALGIMELGKDEWYRYTLNGRNVRDTVVSLYHKGYVWLGSSATVGGVVPRIKEQ